MKEHIIFGLEELFGKETIKCPSKWQSNGLRYCIDTRKDLDFLRKVLKELDNHGKLLSANTDDIIALVKSLTPSEEILNNSQKGW